MRSPVELASVYRAQGRKLTPQRRLMFQLIHDNDKHPTAEALYAIASANMPGISLRTVYQTLNELAEMGELQLIDVGIGATRFDPNIDDHHHAVCHICGEIRDVYVDGAALLKPTGAEEFSVTDVGVLFHGTCKKCSVRSGRSGSFRSRKSSDLHAKSSNGPLSQRKGAKNER
ncbi:MAG: Fur family transcriptional regulator [Ilumatobacteraceae bacterium]